VRILAKLLLRRLVQAVPVLVLIVAGSFLVLQLAPGDMVDVLLAAGGGAPSPEMVAELRRYYGLDQPVHMQLLYYFDNVLRLDFGYSFAHDQAVVDVLRDRLPVTLILVFASVVLAAVLGMMLGIVAARHWQTMIDEVIRVVGLLFYATPSFWLSLILILVFGIQLGWFPINGFETIGSMHTGLARAIDIAHHLFLPTVALSLIFSAIYMQLMRASILEVVGLDYTLTARSKGLDENRVMRGHVLPNAVLPVVTMMGLQISTLLGGAVVVETVFAIPGLGSLAYQSVMQRDLNMLMGILIVSAIMTIVANVLIDVLYHLIDPRIQVS